jgi:hypothetical protein
MTILGKPKSLTIHVAVVFAVRFTVLAATLISFSYMWSRSLVLDAARKLADARLDLLVSRRACDIDGSAGAAVGTRSRASVQNGKAPRSPKPLPWFSS